MLITIGSPRRSGATPLSLLENQSHNTHDGKHDYQTCTGGEAGQQMTSEGSLIAGETIQ